MAGEGALPGTRRTRRSWRSRRTRSAAVGTAVVIAAAGGWVVSGAVHGIAPSATAGQVPTGTATVVRTDLVTTTQVPGTLGYAGTYQVINQLTGGIVTALPRPGTVIRRGQQLYEAAGVPVPLWYGARPMWRTLGAGVTPGPDVRQLNRNLLALGYTDGGYLTVSDAVTAATTAAVSAWQAATGQQVTGVIQLGQVVFASGPVRVDSVTAALGSQLQAGTAILSATSTRRSVDVQVPVAQEYLVRAGDPVIVTLPDGTSTTPGVVTAIAPVATTAGAAGNGPAAAGSGSQAASNSGGTGGTATATVDMTVRLVDPRAAGQYDQAPVEVNIVDARATNVLAVPVTALVALAGGGYGLDVLSGSRQTLVAVRTGLFASALVQVSGSGLQAGMRVEVPS